MAVRFDEALDIFLRVLCWREVHRAMIVTMMPSSSLTWPRIRSVSGAAGIVRGQLPFGWPDGYISEELAEYLQVLRSIDETKPFFAQAHIEPSKDDQAGGELRIMSGGQSTIHAKPLDFPSGCSELLVHQVQPPCEGKHPSRVSCPEVAQLQTS